MTRRRLAGLLAAVSMVSVGAGLVGAYAIGTYTPPPPPHRVPAQVWHINPREAWA